LARLVPDASEIQKLVPKVFRVVFVVTRQT
jgi:hypothetical protein